MKSTLCLLFAILASAVCSAQAQSPPISQQMADTAMTRVWAGSPNGAGVPPKWVYDFGVITSGLKTLWQSTGDRRYFDHIKKGVDTFVNDDGTIKTYKVEDYNLDQIRMGTAVMTLYRVTGEAKYKKAAELLRSQLKNQPRTSEGGFWHKKIYPSQMWLDGLYMGEPFFAEYAETFNEPQDFDDIASQFIWMESHVRDPRTGLLYHGWDESKKMPWADKSTGRAPMFWGRAVGWYVMALVDVLDYLPKDHPKRAQLIAILNRTLEAVEKVQDKQSGTWWLILDLPGRKGNYLEASASCMFAYAMAKGVRMGYLPPRFSKTAANAWAGIQKEFVAHNANGVDLLKTIGGAGLGGTPYRDGSFEYYTGENVVTNDPKGIGAFLLAAVEMEKVPDLRIGAGRSVMLDDYFNHEVKKDEGGRMAAWHYKWNEWPNSGFGLWGSVFNDFGAITATLSTEPTAVNLGGASVYIIVDPDTEKESTSPKSITPDNIKTIADWVKRGGVLVMMANDLGNCELDHFSELGAKFGITFNKDSLNRVQGTNFAEGLVTVTSPNEVFTTARRLYLKEVSSLNVTSPAKPLVSQAGHVLIATAKYGKGSVFAVGDPWLYNEYVDGRKLPADYDNFKAAQDLSRWVLSAARAK
jgi:unsaturated rhamnogalacturonyl hydrolase